MHDGIHDSSVNRLSSFIKAVPHVINILIILYHDIVSNVKA